jgi:dolichol-phosphate mannosyltransferase
VQETHQSLSSCEWAVVVPAYNEQDNVGLLAQEVVAALSPCGKAFELVLVDDASSDATWARIEDAARRHGPAVRGIRMSRRSGQTAAMLAGLKGARGSILATMDGDLQNDPADLPGLFERVAGCDVVCGYRANRRDTWSRRVASRIANRIRNWVTRDGIRDTGCSLKVFRRECLDDLPPLRGMHRFMPAYFRLHGRRIEEVPVNHRARQHGTSKYTNLRRLPTTALDLAGFWWYRQRLIAQPAERN